MSPELSALIGESRDLREKLRFHSRARASLAQEFRDRVRESASKPLRLPNWRLAAMTSFVLEAHRYALWEENGQTIDILTDALEHLEDRLRREVIQDNRDC